VTTGVKKTTVHASSAEKPATPTADVTSVIIKFMIYSMR